MEPKEFFKEAKEKFGNKIVIKQLTMTGEAGEKLLSATGITKEEVEKYPEQAWIPTTEKEHKYKSGYLCPACERPLGGLLGSFSWGIAHGQGYCQGCKKAHFQLYHYIGKSSGCMPLELFSLIGFK